MSKFGIKEKAIHTLKEKSDELKEFVLRPLEIKTTVYEKLEIIARHLKLPPNLTVENLINEIYDFMHEEGEI